MPQQNSRLHEPNSITAPQAKHHSSHQSNGEIKNHRPPFYDLNPTTVLWLQSTIGNAAVQRMLLSPDRVIQREMTDKEVAQRYNNFVQSAERYGMPVKFLKVVQQNVNLRVTTGIDHFSPAYVGRGNLNFEENTMRNVGNMSPRSHDEISRPGAITNIYHESVHAYLLSSSDKDIEAFNRAGEAYYKNAPLKGGKTASDAKRLFQEAAAEYVGSRIKTWWEAFEGLSDAASGSLPPDKAATAVEQARKKYNQGMAERTFGYTMTGPFWSEEQTETTRPMTEGMKKFLDQNILEGKISDAFDTNAGFQQLIAQAQALGSQKSQTPNP